MDKELTIAGNLISNASKDIKLALKYDDLKSLGVMLASMPNVSNLFANKLDEQLLKAVVKPLLEKIEVKLVKKRQEQGEIKITLAPADYIALVRIILTPSLCNWDELSLFEQVVFRRIVDLICRQC